MERIIALLLGYVFGLFSTGKVVSKSKGVDLTKHGSGNTGATNSMRVMGKTAGAMVLLGDSLKAFIPCMIIRFALGAGQPDACLLYVVYAGLGAVLGHDYPVINKFKGGKGIASTFGFVAATLDWRIFLLMAGVFIIIVALTRFVSLASIISCIVLCVSWTGFNANELIRLGADYRLESCLLVFIMMLLGVIRHKSNILRLMSGTENKISFS